MAKLIKQSKRSFHLKRWLIMLAVLVIGGLGVYAYFQWSGHQSEQKVAQKKAADARATKAAIETENTRQLKELEQQKPAASASTEEKNAYLSDTMDVHVRLKEYATALSEFQKLEKTVQPQDMDCFDLVNGAVAYAEQGDKVKAKELFTEAEKAAKRQTSDPIDYQIYIDYINDKRKEVL